jgi:hypothetical protein
MHFQFDMSAVHYPSLADRSAGTTDLAELLRQILEVERDQLQQLRAFLSAHDAGARWRAFLSRWKNNFPELPESCRQAMPVLEQTYGKLIAELTEQLCQNDSDALEDDFSLQEFLDRYGMRLTQLGTILNLVAPLAEAGSHSESA